MIFPKPWEKHPLVFHVFLLLTWVHWFEKRKLGDNLIQSTNIKYKLPKIQNYFYDWYHSTSRTKTDAKWTKPKDQ